MWKVPQTNPQNSTVPNADPQNPTGIKQNPPSINAVQPNITGQNPAGQLNPTGINIDPNVVPNTVQPNPVVVWQILPEK